MKAVNKIVKGTVKFLTYLFVLLQSFITGLFVISPLVCTLGCVTEWLPFCFPSKITYIWLLSGLFAGTGIFTATLVKVHKDNKEKLELLKGEKE